MKRNGWASCSGRGGVHFVTGCVAAGVEIFGDVALPH